MKKRLISAVTSLVVMATPIFGLGVSASDDETSVQFISFDYEDTLYFSPKGSTKLAITDKDGYASERSLLITGRTKATDGAQLSVKTDGTAQKYNVSLWVKADSAMKITATLAGKKINSANVLVGEWTKISGTVDVGENNGNINLEVYSADGNGDFSIDNVTVLGEGEVLTTPLMPEGMNMITNGDFETGEVAPFADRVCNVSVNESSAHSGKYGASVTNRTESWMGIQLNIKDLLVQECNYEASAWIRLDDLQTETADFYLQLDVTENGQETRYPGITKVTAKQGEWVQVKGIFSTNDFMYPLDSLSMYIASADDNKCDFSVDDVTLSYTNERVQSGGSHPADANPWVNRELKPLKDSYKDYFLLGSARSSDTDDASAVEDDMIAYHYDTVTMGNAMKPDALENRKGKFTWDTADYILSESEKRGTLMHGHVLVWHEQSPAWLNTDVSRDEAIENLRNYIFDVMEHYKGKCYSWDVVNEAIDGITDASNVSGILRNTPWRRAIGDDYIELAFKFAAEADPDALLYYNDFNLDDAQKADAVVTLVKSLQEKGIKIDGIGMQGHYNTNTSITAVENSIKKFKALGVKISVSELDVNCYSMKDGVLTYDDQVIQAQKYAQLFKLYKKYSDVIDRVTLWGVDDATSWRAEGYPLPFDKDYQPKEAYYAILDPEGYLEAHPVTAKRIDRGVAIKGTPEIDGEIDAVWNNAPDINVNKYVMAWQGSTGVVKTLWDENNLYVLFDVEDKLLSTVSDAVYMQDSVEIFVDENNGKTTYFETDDGHFRVNCENAHSFGTGGSDEGFVTVTKKTDKGYLVEMAIPWKTKRTETGIIGFEAQVNDDSKGDGNRTSITKFSDTSDLSWSSTENFGELILTENGEVDDMFVVLNGRTVNFDVAPMIMNDRTMVPFRKLLEELEAQVSYDEDGRYVTAKKDGVEIVLQIDNTTAIVNGEEKTLDAAPVIIDGRTLIPLRFVSEYLNGEVNWHGNTRTVTIEI